MHQACRWRARGATEEEVLAKIAEHVRQKHAVKSTTATIVNFVRSSIRQT